MSEKSRGIIAFAHNTPEVDYISIAHKTLGIASQFLKLPYTLITDDIEDASWTNTRYDIDSEKFVEWRNGGRHHAYNLSPYDETIAIDVDYLVMNDSLLKIFETEWDYLLKRSAISVSGKVLADTMGPHSLPFVWATVFAFRKTAVSNLYFELVDRIKRNYSYYRELFNIDQRNYRNDFSFAIADIIMRGYCVDTDSIPGNMVVADEPIYNLEFIGPSQKLLIVRGENTHIIPRTNLHIMSKRYLMSKEFDKFLEELKRAPA